MVGLVVGPARLGLGDVVGGEPEEGLAPFSFEATVGVGVVVGLVVVVV